MTELLIRYNWSSLIAWLVIVILFAFFVFSLAYTQLNVRFSEEKVSEEKRVRISGEVFGNILAHVIFIASILALGIAGFYAEYRGAREYRITSAPGEQTSWG